MEGFIGGWRMDLEDVDGILASEMHLNDAELAMATAAEGEGPQEIDPRPWSKMKNQKKEGSCQGHSASTAGAGCRYVANEGKEYVDFSADLTYYLTQQHDGITGDNGSTIAGGMWVAKEIGFAPESFMPYTDRYNPQDVPPNYKEVCEPNRVQKCRVLRTYRDAFNWLRSGNGFISYGIPWRVSICPDGKMQWTPGGRGGHANAMMGYGPGRDSEGLPDFLWGQNSWGDWEVLHGFYKITRSTFEQFAADRSTVIVGISDMLRPVPRNIDFLANSVIQ